MRVNSTAGRHAANSHTAPLLTASTTLLCSSPRERDNGMIALPCSTAWSGIVVHNLPQSCCQLIWRTRRTFDAGMRVFVQEQSSLTAEGVSLAPAPNSASQSAWAWMRLQQHLFNRWASSFPHIPAKRSLNRLLHSKPEIRKACRARVACFQCFFFFPSLDVAQLSVVS